MLEVKFTVDGSRCTTDLFIANPDKYQGLLICLECGKRAWFTKSYKTKNGDRTACFGARHEDDCLKATTILEAEDMEGIDQDENGDATSADIVINLDKTKHGSIEKVPIAIKQQPHPTTGNHHQSRMLLVVSQAFQWIDRYAKY